jgi:transposase
MAKPYSYDLRQKVIQAIKVDGLKKSEASQIFNISRNPINLWLKRLSQTGDYQAKPNQPPGNGPNIADSEEFREKAKADGDKTQVDMAKLSKEHISSPTISRALKKIGFTRKKRLMAFPERDEAKGQAFVAHLSTLVASQIVDVDESPDG